MPRRNGNGAEQLVESLQQLPPLHRSEAAEADEACRMQSYRLAFHSECLELLNKHDCLIILGKGLGLDYLYLQYFTQFLQFPTALHTASTLLNTFAVKHTTAGHAATASSSSSPSPAGTSSPSAIPTTTSPYLIFLLNFSDDQIHFLNHLLQTQYFPINDHAQTQHSAKNAPISARGIQSINNEFNVLERQRLYVNGGILSITARILTVDLLNKVIQPDLIQGIVVNRAHQSVPEHLLARMLLSCPH